MVKQAGQNPRRKAFLLFLLILTGRTVSTQVLNSPRTRRPLSDRRPRRRFAERWTGRPLPKWRARSRDIGRCSRFLSTKRRSWAWGFAFRGIPAPQRAKALNSGGHLRIRIAAQAPTLFHWPRSRRCTLPFRPTATKARQPIFARHRAGAFALGHRRRRRVGRLRIQCAAEFGVGRAFLSKPRLPRHGRLRRLIRSGLIPRRANTRIEVRERLAFSAFLPPAAKSADPIARIPG